MTDSDIVERSDGLDSSLDTGGVVTVLIDGLRRQRHISQWLIISIIFDVIITFAFVIYVNQIQNNAMHIDIVNSQSVQLCELGNKFRQDDLNLWLGALPRMDGISNANKTIIARNASNVFAARTCVINDSN